MIDWGKIEGVKVDAYWRARGAYGARDAIRAAAPIVQQQIAELGESERDHQLREALTSLLELIGVAAGASVDAARAASDAQLYASELRIR